MVKFGATVLFPWIVSFLKKNHSWLCCSQQVVYSIHKFNNVLHINFKCSFDRNCQILIKFVGSLTFPVCCWSWNFSWCKLDHSQQVVWRIRTFDNSHSLSITCSFCRNHQILKKIEGTMDSPSIVDLGKKSPSKLDHSQQVVWRNRAFDNTYALIITCSFCRNHQILIQFATIADSPSIVDLGTWVHANLTTPNR